MAGDAETGVTMIKLVEELDAGPIAAQRAFPIGPDDDAGAVYARAAEVGAELLDEVLPAPAFTPQPERGRHVRREADPGRPRARLGRVRAEELAPTGCARSRRTSARAPSSRAAAVDRLARARRGRRLVPVEVQPDGAGA